MARRSTAALLAVLMLAGCAAAESAALDVSLRAVEGPAKGSRIGALELTGAYEIVDRSRRVSGLSALELADDHLLLLGDRGRLFRASRVSDEAGGLIGLEDWAELPLPEAIRTADTEALARLPDGTLVIAAEDRDELYRLAPDLRPRGSWPLPDFLREAPLNEGIEALAALPDGGLLAVTEGLRLAPDRVGAAHLRGSSATLLALRTPDGFKPTGSDAAGGFLFVLQRRVSLLGGLEARLLALPLPPSLGWEPGTLLDGQELARLGRDFQENFEGIAVSALEDGRYRILLVADDNGAPLLRTLLLELVWQAPRS